jgi:hypothetical protein
MFTPSRKKQAGAGNGDGADAGSEDGVGDACDESEDRVENSGAGRGTWARGWACGGGGGLLHGDILYMAGGRRWYYKGMQEAPRRRATQDGPAPTSTAHPRDLHTSTQKVSTAFPRTQN